MMKHWQAHIGIAAELRILIGSFVILVACVSSQAIAQSPRSDWLTESERAKFEQLRIAGSEALFNLDYERARKNFKEMAQSLPNYPAGPQFLADTLWVETLYQTRRLQSSLYGDDDTFYSTSDDKADPRVVDQFRALTRQARILAEARGGELPPPSERVVGTGATLAVSVANGADIVRVHDVAHAVEVVRVTDAIVRV